MPFDGDALRVEGRLYRGKQAKARRAADLLAFVRQRFVTHEWRWIKGELSDGKGGFCILGGVIEAGQQRLTTIDGVLPYLARAITKGRVPWPWERSPAGMRTVIEYYNDHTRSFVRVMEKLADATIIAEADAESG